jgi:hypothetical protein
MYGSVLGATTTGAGVLVLPNTGGNNMLTIAAVTSIAIGCVILATSVVRMVAKRVYKG